MVVKYTDAEKAEIIKKYTDADRAELKRVADENSTPDEVDCGTLNSTTLYHNNFKIKFKQLKEAIKDLQRARDIIAYHREQQASFWNEDMWNVLIAVEEDIEYLTGELSMVKLNKIAEDLEKNGYLKEEKR